MISISAITVTQEGVHTAGQIPNMIEHVQNGGFFTQELLNEFADIYHSGTKPSGVIKITQFEDGNLFLQDGHHRTLSIYLGGRAYLDPSEFIFEHWKYSDYLEINFDNKWVTPIDVKTQVRQANFKDFKTKALWRYEEHGPEVATEYIKSNSGLYLRERSVYSIVDLAKIYEAEHSGLHSRSTQPLSPK